MEHLMKFIKLAMTFGLGTLLLATTTVAQEQGDKFAALDKNKDNLLTPAEVHQDPQLSKHWTSVDKDRSGTIDRVEFSAFETHAVKSKSAIDKSTEMKKKGYTTKNQ
jgi:hypothetical protein